jgi:hypothetical protein
MIGEAAVLVNVTAPLAFYQDLELSYFREGTIGSPLRYFFLKYKMLP